MKYTPQPVPFYESTAEQLFRKGYMEGKNYEHPICAIFTEAAVILPRMDIVRLISGASTTQFQVINADTDAVTLSLSSSYFQVRDLGTNAAYEALSHIGGVSITTGTGVLSDGGSYYCKVVSGGISYYSERFQFRFVTASESGFLSICDEVVKLSWSNSCPILDEYHITGEFFMYLFADPGAPVYEVNEEGDEDASGNFTPAFQRIEKRQKIEVYGGESLADALSVLPMFDSVNITFSDGNVWAITVRETIQADWDEDNVYGKHTVTFVRRAIVKAGCC